MKKLFTIIPLVILLCFIFGCQKQGNQDKKEPMTSKSGELVFGNKNVTHTIEGKGSPCFVCADGNLQTKCLSENLKNHIQFIFLEQRHSTYYGEPKDYSDISMDTILDDIETLRKKLKSDKIYVLGHSIIGLIAIEYGRKYPQNTKGVIMLNTPPHFHNDYMDIVSKNWSTNASEERKKIYKSNKERLNNMNLDSLSEAERTAMQYQANVPMYFYDPLYDISPAFQEYRENTEGWNHFYAMMRDYDITRSKINLPIFLSLGSYDFMVPYSLWDDYIEKFPTLTVIQFKKSGHFPQLEEQELFDNQLLSWIKDN